MAKLVTITAVVGDDTTQNQVKDWLKTCPYSLEGKQTIAWQNIPDEKKPEDETDSQAESGNVTDEKAA